MTLTVKSILKLFWNDSYRLRALSKIFLGFKVLTVNTIFCFEKEFCSSGIRYKKSSRVMLIKCRKADFRKYGQHPF